MRSLAELLDMTTAMHRHLCPRQVLGVRMGIYAGAVLELPLPQTEKRLIAIVETYGCTLDGIVVATNCLPGRRTMRVEDFGKVAATFIDTRSGRAVRIVPRRTIRTGAAAYAPGASSKWQAQLVGYQRMPDEELFELQEVQTLIPIEKLISRPGCKAVCDRCGEEIANEREVVDDRMILCRACAGGSYYALLAILPTTSVEASAMTASRLT